MVVARTSAAREALKEQFAAHSIDREYVALCNGEVKSRTFATMHGRHPTDRLRFTSHVVAGKRAVTTVRTIETFGRAAASHVSCRLETGRTPPDPHAPGGERHPGAGRSALRQAARRTRRRASSPSPSGTRRCTRGSSASTTRARASGCASRRRRRRTSSSRWRPCARCRPEEPASEPLGEKREIHHPGDLSIQF